ncbi:thioredoxin fold domain-containing protein [Tropicimonas sediminicola]|uniref:Thioredoxin-like domain-containing protein n=1 Tax=Tropicimonas sediminicola TaxID=1031541 RepID=A0A239F7H6_9RHOB|nr:thioredoxin fold domain-containing protein [Tropicimonas sediminicola]SNS52775.1 Thioredoxin-like domain-containing protein [Tropicimonas sediminicola]
MSGILRVLAVSAMMALAALPGHAVELVMVEQAGCSYCARWEDEIGPIYPKTPEGAHAPLRRVDLRGDEIDALRLKRRVNFTPTFILIDADGQEIARLEGYPGEDFFWGLIERMLQENTAYRPPVAAGG